MNILQFTQSIIADCLINFFQTDVSNFHINTFHIIMHLAIKSPVPPNQKEKKRKTNLLNTQKYSIQAYGKMASFLWYG